MSGPLIFISRSTVKPGKLGLRSARRSMINVAHAVLIERPAADVFAYVADQSNEHKWHTDVLEVDPNGPVGLGSRVTWLVKFMGKSHYSIEVTAFEPPRQIQLTTREGPLRPTLTHTFAQVDAGTQYERRVQIPLPGRLRLLEVMMRTTGAARRRNAGFAENLKRVLER